MHLVKTNQIRAVDSCTRVWIYGLWEGEGVEMENENLALVMLTCTVFFPNILRAFYSLLNRDLRIS